MPLKNHTTISRLQQGGIFLILDWHRDSGTNGGVRCSMLCNPFWSGQADLRSALPLSLPAANPELAVTKKSRVGFACGPLRFVLRSGARRASEQCPFSGFSDRVKACEMRDPISTELVGVTIPAPLKPRLPENLQVSANEVWAAPARGLSRRKPPFRLTQPWARPVSQRRPPSTISKPTVLPRPNALCRPLPSASPSRQPENILALCC